MTYMEFYFLFWNVRMVIIFNTNECFSSVYYLDTSFFSECNVSLNWIKWIFLYTRSPWSEVRFQIYVHDPHNTVLGFGCNNLGFFHLYPIYLYEFAWVAFGHVASSFSFLWYFSAVNRISWMFFLFHLRCALFCTHKGSNAHSIIVGW